MAKSSIVAGRAVLSLSIDDTALKAQFDKLQRKVQQTAGKIRGAGLAIGAIGGAIVGPLALAINKAGEANEIFSKFSVVFGENTEAVKDWSDNLATSLGRSKTEVAGFLASFQDLFVPLGFDPVAAEAMSKQVSQLAIDLASFNNMADADVVRDLSAALTGSGEVMKKYGVIVSAAAVKQELLNKNLDPSAVTEAQKAQARLDIIMRGTTAAQGDAARTSKSYTNQMKALDGAISDAAVELGKVFLPLAADMVGLAVEAVNIIAAWVVENKDLVYWLGIVGATLLTTGAALVAIGSAMSVASIAAGGLAVAFAFLSANPIVLIIAGVVALGLAIAALIDWMGWLGDEADETGDVMEEVGRKNQDAAAKTAAEISKVQTDALEKAAAMQRDFEAQLPAIGGGAVVAAPIMQAAASQVDKDQLSELKIQTDVLVDTFRLLRDGGGLVVGAF